MIQNWIHSILKLSAFTYQLFHLVNKPAEIFVNLKLCFSEIFLYLIRKYPTMELKGKQNLIGRIDKADFPRINLKRIRVKIDTGAYTSAIHCCKIEETDQRRLKVVFLDPDDPKYTGKAYLYKKYSKKTVKSSNGEREDRFIITMKICFHRRLYKVEFSLTYRGDMRHPVLIGRKFLAENHFIVNPQLRNYFHKKKRAEKLLVEDH
jgi:hypothetical protein